VHRIFVLALMALASPAFANGVITEFPGTGLIFKEAADIGIAREDLFLSLDKITVHYDYQSDAAGTQTVTIGFPMPAVPINGDPSDPANFPELEGKDIRNYMQFSARVNGEPVETTLHQFAWYEGEDITARLTAIGVSPYLAYDEAEAAFANVDPAVVEQLAEAGIIGTDEERSYVSPNWLYQTVYEWQQDFAPGLTKVDIAYAPLTGYPGDIGATYEDDDEGTYCVDDKVRATIAGWRDKHVLYEVQTLGYITTTAAYWKGPIGEFNLTIAKEQPNPEYSQVATETSFCGRTEMVETATGFTWTAKDYVPAEDISVVWYSFYDYGWEEPEVEIDEPGVLDELQKL
jgi:hypothetical protein